MLYLYAENFYWISFRHFFLQKVIYDKRPQRGLFISHCFSLLASFPIITPPPTTKQFFLYIRQYVLNKIKISRMIRGKVFYSKKWFSCFNCVCSSLIRPYLPFIFTPRLVVRRVNGNCTSSSSPDTENIFPQWYELKVKTTEMNIWRHPLRVQTKTFWRRIPMRVSLPPTRCRWSCLANHAAL